MLTIMLPTTIVVILGSQHYKTILLGGGTLAISNSPRVAQFAGFENLPKQWRPLRVLWNATVFQLSWLLCFHRKQQLHAMN